MKQIKKIKNRLQWTIIILLIALTVYGQNNIKINSTLLNSKWKSHWITYPDVSLTDYGVFHFRKTFDLQAQPDEFIIHVSGDNRYRLFVNGEEVCKGPARGDLAHWLLTSKKMIR